MPKHPPPPGNQPPIPPPPPVLPPPPPPDGGVEAKLSSVPPDSSADFPHGLLTVIMLEPVIIMIFVLYMTLPTKDVLRHASAPNVLSAVSSSFFRNARLGASADEAPACLAAAISFRSTDIENGSIGRTVQARATPVTVKAAVARTNLLAGFIAILASCQRGTGGNRERTGRRFVPGRAG
ncbi:hypothetical protein D7T58_11075 [Stenotrophomonas maltophilia]|nr:hypothetical protein [Stenotrophomonas maltophilia]MBA0469234.1 hypothetical protein [Stenotrophomonas maltophilia]MBA0476802.1 hypothetical protein [Stenotrophomonas maltophilia]MBA0485289.1 hypothetical protein [Stenotrophomonas maltophilia]QGL90212.1 hypothetical protein FEO91_18590 [Stenotrophomonas maltophilia]